MVLQADSHVHSQWSWDAPHAWMEQTCARALELGLPAVAFTEHLDHSSYTVEADVLVGKDHLTALYADGRLTPPPFDADGYLQDIARCRDRFPGLRILSGLEVGEPHWHADAVTRILGAGEFDRVLGSLHCLPDGDGFSQPPDLFAHRDAYEVMRTYLGEIVALVSGSDDFAVLAHIDYPVRSWPLEQFNPLDFEDEFRLALRATAGQARRWR